MVPDKVIVEILKEFVNKQNLMKTKDEKAKNIIELFDFIIKHTHFVFKHKKVNDIIIAKAKEMLVFNEYPELIEKSKLVLEMFNYQDNMELDH